MIGNIILIIAAICEISFAVFCICTKSYQKKGKAIIRIGAFTAFLIFTLASVIEWSFRWMGLGLLLLVWALSGVWTLIRSKEEHKEYKSSRVIRNAIAMLMLVLIAITPALVFPQYHLSLLRGSIKSQPLHTPMLTKIVSNNLQTQEKIGTLMLSFGILNRQTKPIHCWYFLLVHSAAKKAITLPIWSLRATGT